MGIKIVAQPIIVGENEAFEQDVLGRKDFGESLLNLVSLSSDELVISLDGKWGEGKTTFVKMWQGLLDKKDITNIYVNAFENDYSDDAFIAIAGAITAYIAEHENKDKVNLDDFKEKAKIIGMQLLPLVAQVAVRTVTLGVIKDSDIKELNDIKDNMAKGLSAAVDNFIGERLESHKKDLETIQSFKRLLSEIPTRINSEGDNPLVIIIDELDRCKPTYALDLIEKVKHLFSVKNIVFVLVMNREQLEKSVKSVYGQEFDAHTYLQKFINIETAIPKKTGKHYDSDIAKYNRRLFELHQIQTWGDAVLEYLEALAKHFNLSLRQLERVYTNMAIFYATSAEEDKVRIVPIVSFLAVIKVIKLSMYNDLFDQEISYKDLCLETKLLDEKEYENEKELRLVVKYLKFSLIPEIEFNKLSQDNHVINFHNLLKHYDISREEFIPYFTKKLSMFTLA